MAEKKKVLNFETAKGHHTPITDPSVLKYAERTPFIRSLVGAHEVPGDSIEDMIFRGSLGSGRLREFAATYVKYRNMGARLPAFPRWVSSMFKDDKETLNEIAKIGQSHTALIVNISDKPEDILRAGDIGYSCLSNTGGYHYVLEKIVEENSGVAVAFTTDPRTGKFAGRCFINHAVDDKDGADMLVVNPVRGNLQHSHLFRIFQPRGIKLARPQNEYVDATKPTGAFTYPVKLIGNFKKQIHYDVCTWPPNKVQYVELIQS